MVSLRDLSKNKAAAPAPAPETRTDTAAPVDTAALTVFGEAGANAALIAAIDEVGQGRGVAFPLIQVTGGNSSSAGTYGPLADTPDEIATKLPAGRTPILAVFLGYRTEVLAWPTGYNDRGEEGGAPAWSAVIAPRAVEDAKLAAQATEVYQFTKGASKAKFDACGHARPSLQLLVYLPSLDGCAIIQAPAHHQSWLNSIQELKRLVDPTTKELGQFPATISTDVESKSNPSFKWQITSLKIAQTINDASKAMWDKFMTWRQAVGQDPEQVATIREWLNGDDRPMNDTIRDKMRQIVALK